MLEYCNANLEQDFVRIPLHSSESLPILLLVHTRDDIEDFVEFFTNTTTEKKEQIEDLRIFDNNFEE